MFTSIQAWIARVSPLSAARYDARAHERLRLYALLTIALLKMLNFFGGGWDIQWHVAIGRDSAFIPPHLLVLTAFTGGLSVVLVAMAYETYLAQSGIQLERAARLGAIRAPAAYFGVYFGYTAALLSGVFDELWHRAFGVDATLWSPPHMAIMVSTQIVDVSLMLGIVAAARHLDYKFNWRSPLFWGVVVTGAYLLESICFQMSEAFIEGFRAGGVGLWGILFPILVGAFYPFYLMLAIRLSGRFWTAVPIFAATIILQYVGIGLAAAGFEVLRPVSAIEDFVRQNPGSTIAMARTFANLTGGGGLIGFKQAWTIWLTGAPAGLVAALTLWPWAHRHRLIAAPVFSASLVILAYIWFQYVTFLRDYPTTWLDVALGVVIAGSGGLVFGRAGLALADKFDPDPKQ